MKFRAFYKEFESIETSPGFAQLLGEIGFKVIEINNAGQNLSNDKSLEVNVVISQKKWVAQFLTRKMTWIGMNKNPEN